MSLLILVRLPRLGRLKRREIAIFFTSCGRLFTGMALWRLNRPKQPEPFWIDIK